LHYNIVDFGIILYDEFVVVLFVESVFVII